MNKASRSYIFALIFALSVFPIFCEAGGSKDKINEADSINYDALRASENKENSSGHDEENIAFTGADGKIEKDQRRGESFWLLLRVLVVLFIVILAAYFVLLLLKKATRIEESDDPFFRLITTLNLGSGKNVVLLTLLDKAYLVGVSETAVSLIAEINDKDLIDSMNVYFDKNQNVNKPRNFSDILNIFLKSAKKSGGIYSENSDFSKVNKRDRDE